MSSNMCKPTPVLLPIFFKYNCMREFKERKKEREGGERGMWYMVNEEGSQAYFRVDHTGTG